MDAENHLLHPAETPIISLVRCLDKVPRLARYCKTARPIRISVSISSLPKSAHVAHQKHGLMGLPAIVACLKALGKAWIPAEQDLSKFEWLELNNCPEGNRAASFSSANDALAPPQHPNTAPTHSQCKGKLIVSAGCVMRQSTMRCFRHILFVFSPI